MMEELPGSQLFHMPESRGRHSGGRCRDAAVEESVLSAHGEEPRGSDAVVAHASSSTEPSCFEQSQELHWLNQPTPTLAWGIAVIPELRNITSLRCFSSSFPISPSSLTFLFSSLSPGHPFYLAPHSSTTPHSAIPTNIILPALLLPSSLIAAAHSHQQSLTLTVGCRRPWVHHRLVPSCSSTDSHLLRHIHSCTSSIQASTDTLPRCLTTPPTSTRWAPSPRARPAASRTAALPFP